MNHIRLRVRHREAASTRGRPAGRPSNTKCAAAQSNAPPTWPAPSRSQRFCRSTSTSQPFTHSSESATRCATCPNPARSAPWWSNCDPRRLAAGSARTKHLVRRRRSRVNPRQDTSSFMAPVRNAKPSRNAGRLRKRRRSRAIPGRAGRAGTNHDREMDHPRADALPERSPAGPRARCLSVTKPASGMVVGIPPGRAEHATKPCTGRR